MKPVDALLAVTYRCNARCVMCGIWKSDPCSEMPAETYRKLPRTLRDINLSGGEPFLRDDLAAIHASARKACPHARTIISTNGLLTRRIVSCVREIARIEPAVGIAVSLDGPEELHDDMRGVRGAFKHATATVRALQDAGFTNIRFAFTATPINFEHIGTIYELAQEFEVQFTCAVEHGSEHYFHSTSPEQRMPYEELRRQFAPLIHSELHSLSPKRWARAYYMHGLVEFGSGGRRPLPCFAGRDFFFMDPTGNIYVCNAAPFRMGNLSEQNFDELWTSAEAWEAREKAAHCQAGCWMICTARTAIKRSWPRVLAWVLKSRISRIPCTRSPA